MNNITKINIRALCQFILVVAVVFAVGLFIKDSKYHTKRDSMDDSDIISTEGLPITGIPVSEYPEKYFGSDKAWNKYVKKSDDKTTNYHGEGYISNHSIELDMIVESGGAIIGRYHNSNGTNLDLNGYVEPGTGNLYINLGHASDKTLSNWKLKPKKSDHGNHIYTYEGTWGKKNLPSELTLIRNVN